MKKQKPLSETHPSIADELQCLKEWADCGMGECANDYNKATKELEKDMLKIQKHTRDVVKIREAIKKTIKDGGAIVCGSDTNKSVEIRKEVLEMVGDALLKELEIEE